ncbi:MAG TPA: hypothetical protein VK969_08560 [Acidimicrobiia bacterium]|nr:hypothetical protein [Acidimicrobiia bacterium]
MVSNTLLALQDGYWLAGILTLIAAGIVAVVILVNSHSEDDQIR